MEILYKVPSWFSGYDAFLQILFALVALFVAVYSFRIYRISGEHDVQLFGYAFVLIALSYIAWPLISFFATLPIDGTTAAVFFQNEDPEHTLAIYFHVLLFLLGLTTLAYSTLKTKDPKVYVLLSMLVVAPILMAVEKSNLVYLLSSILVFFVLVHHFDNYRQKRNKKMLIVTFAFFFLFLATLDFIFSDNGHIYYVGGHFLMLISYLLIWGRLALNYGRWRKNGND